MRGIDELTGRLARLAGWKSLLSALAACVLPILGVYWAVARYAVDGPVPDRSWAYTAGEAYEMLVDLGDAGRQGLMLVHVFDYAYIVAYALFFGMAVAGLASVLYPASLRLRRLAVLPVLAALADVFENVCVDAAILSLPRRADMLLSLAGGFTTVKAALLTTSQLLVLLGLVLVLVRFAWKRIGRAVLRPASAG